METATSPRDALHQQLYDAATKYLDQGWSIFPLSVETKKPLNEWAHYQTRQPTHEEVEDWFTNGAPTASGGRERLFNLAVVTGRISGLLVIDCDSADAVAEAERRGWRSPFRVRTTRGQHLYFLHPGQHARYPNRAGIDGVSGLDMRGDGGYVVAPPSIKASEGRITHQYKWEPCPLDWDDCPIWGGKPALLDVTDATDFSFDQLDLTHVAVRHPDDYLTTWERTARLVAEIGKLPTGGGNQRNERIRDYASERIRDGLFGDALREACHQFEDAFYKEPLDPREFEATVHSMEEAERRNHPERFRADGTYIVPADRMPQISLERRPFTTRDLALAKAKLASERWAIEPIMRHEGSIIYIYGYTGHGKSLFLQHLLWHLSLGVSYGPYEIHEPKSVLYFDFENSASTIIDRMEQMVAAYGDPGERMSIWTPSLMEGEQPIDMKSKDGLARFVRWVNEVDPDVVVIDTVRSAWPGLKENDANEWAPINSLAMALRNQGKTCILVHHANKPSDGHMGREAGSTNQLSVVETQIRVTQVFAKEEDADAAVGKHDPDAVARLAALLPPGATLKTSFEISYGKVRERTDNHARSFFGIYETPTGRMGTCASRSPKQRARSMAADGIALADIAARLGLSLAQIERWTHGSEAV